jgi:hypothetical protein
MVSAIFDCRISRSSAHCSESVPRMKIVCAIENAEYSRRMNKALVVESEKIR